MTRLLRPLPLLVLLLTAAPASAAPAAAPAPDPAASTTSAPSDPMSLLAACDSRLEACEQDVIGIPYLAAAYIALWVILLGFFIVIRVRQRALVTEIRELKARLARLTHASGTDP